MITTKYAVTFEFDQQPTKTHRGVVVASSAATCVARAVREAQRVLTPVNWSSMNCVLLERQKRAGGEEKEKGE